MRPGADVHVAQRADEKSAADAVRDRRIARVIGARIRAFWCQRGGDAYDFQPALRRPERGCLERLVAIGTDDGAAMDPVRGQPRMATRTCRTFVRLDLQRSGGGHVGSATQATLTTRVCASMS